MEFNRLFVVKIVALLVVVLAILAVLLSGIDGIEIMSTGDKGTTPTLSTAKTPLTLEQGMDLMISQDANHTTGYSWEVAKSPEFVNVGISYEPSNSQMAGAPGKAIIKITALSTGRGEIVLEYVRPWEKDDPNADKKVVSYLVEVIPQTVQ